MSSETVPFENWFKRDYAHATQCFLCGADLTKTKKTDEHIIPQWVLHMFNLWDKKITLLNTVRFAYNRSVIPCCESCNNNHLSKLEKKIKQGVEGGYAHFKAQVTNLEIYQWCQLIFYKLLYKESFFRTILREPASHNIVTEGNFNAMVLNHFFLRSIDKQLNFENFFPGSIFICRVKTSPTQELNFDYIDDVPSQCFAIRLNDIGIVVILADSGLQQKAYDHLYQDILSHELAPIQFRNFFIKCVYIQHLFSDPFSYIVKEITDDGATIFQAVKADFSGNVYGDWVDENYLQLLASAFNVQPDDMRISNGNAGSFFYDNNGNWKDRSFEDDGFKNSTPT